MCKTNEMFVIVILQVVFCGFRKFIPTMKNLILGKFEQLLLVVFAQTQHRKCWKCSLKAVNGQGEVK